ncbi:3'-5' exonuclease, partial [Helicosporidium sp. ATCC 50920]
GVLDDLANPEAYPPGALKVPDDVELEAGRPAPVEETPFALVDTVPQLRALAERLRDCAELAIDLEAHQYHSFLGFSCLMQLSSRHEDAVIDTLALRSHIGPVLGPLLADPKITKVLHGSDGDVMWLQRDFGCFLANVFDTGQASRVLGYPSAGLAYVLKRHLDLSPDKRYQLADWRVRPLTPGMLAYARGDTHSLLHVHDVLKQELQEHALEHVVPTLVPLDWQPPAAGSCEASPALLLVLERSRRICLQSYAGERWSLESCFAQARRAQTSFADPALSAFVALHRWRHALARRMDESTGAVLSRGPLERLAALQPSSA